jgi:hypothetical protein
MFKHTNNKNYLLSLFKKQVEYLEYINCIGCESQKPHHHTYTPGEFNLLAINQLYNENLISFDDYKWLKQCYINESL